MVFKDPIYGRVKVDEPVLLELIAAPSVQRLKRIGQFSIPDIEGLFRDFTRYVHCVGTMLLLRRLGASLEEQAAGLLHDVSHTAFSHLIDYVVEGGDPEQENYQDKNHDRILHGSELPGILSRHGLDPQRVSDNRRFTLLERPIPDLCADRIDYTLREILVRGQAGVVRSCLDALRIADGQIVFVSRQAASDFAETFLDCYSQHWTDPNHLVRVHLFAETLKQALRKKIITLHDFDTDDESILAKLKASGDPDTMAGLRILNSQAKFTIVTDVTGIAIPWKFRYVDPLFQSPSGLVHLSAVDETFNDKLGRARDHAKHGLRVRISI